MPKSKSKATKDIPHYSADPFEISFLIGGRNEKKLEEMGITFVRNGSNQVTFSSEDESNFEELYPFLDEILLKYRTPTVRTVLLRPEQVAYARGKNSCHLDRMKGASLVENVFFNDREAKGKDGSMTKMVEVAVLGTIPCINKFMSELLSSVLSFQFREMEIEPPERETKEERAARRGAKTRGAEKKKPPRKKQEDEDVE